MNCGSSQCKDGIASRIGVERLCTEAPAGCDPKCVSTVVPGGPDGRCRRVVGCH